MEGYSLKHYGDGRAACGARSKDITKERAKVTCANCKRTKAFAAKEPVVSQSVFELARSIPVESTHYRCPAMEIIEEPSAFSIMVDIPYAKGEDIRVDISPHRVRIEVLPRSPLLKSHISFQDFARTIPLPAEVVPESGEARLNNGVLEVMVPKKILGGSHVYHLPPI